MTGRCAAPEPFMTVTIYHNPRCSKSRQTLQLLQDHQVQTQVVEYLKDPPDERTLDALLTMLDMQPRELLREKESEYREHGFDNPDLARAQLIRMMVRHPRVIERPIVVVDGRAAIGRPPEKVLEIL